ncbi:MAG TPA: hypothetical protein VF544_24195 [Pyrinomonadaceae bacterium]|jgi:hypothetical protein
MPSVIGSILEKLQAAKDLPQEFENLLTGTFEVKSPWTAVYNCIAFAAGEDHRKWWPIPQEYARQDRYWPEGVSRKEEVKSFIAAFQTLGYEPCESPELEEGIEKVALYVNSKDVPTHMARQLPNGKWISKLGDKQDITHDSLHQVEGKTYGTARQILCRPRQIEGAKPSEQESEGRASS